MNTLTIPPRVIPRVRDGAFAGLRNCAEGIDQAGRDLGEHERVRRRLRATWRLLDAIGWSSTDPPVVGMEIDVCEHGGALLAALEPMLTLLGGWLGEIPAGDPRLPARRAELEAVREIVAQTRREAGGQR